MPSKNNKNGSKQPALGGSAPRLPSPASLDLTRIRRPKRLEAEEEEIQAPKPVSAGRVDHIADMMLNPTRESIRGFTVIDRFQGRMFPQMEMLGVGLRYLLEVAQYRQDSVMYEKIYHRKYPIQPDLQGEFLYATAVWNRSVNAKGLDSGMSLVQAEIEGRAEDDGMGDTRDPYADNG